MKKSREYQLKKFPRHRKLIMDFTRLARKKSTIFGLGEFDITETRKIIRQYRVQKKRALSLTAFIINCIGKAVAKNPGMQAYKTWRNRLVLYHQVDLLLPVELEAGDYTFPVLQVLRAVNDKEAADLDEEINRVQSAGLRGVQTARHQNLLNLFLILPGFIRRLTLRILLLSTRWQKKYLGTVALTAVGMFGSGSGWGLGLSNHTLEIVIGAINKKPVLKGGVLEEREFLPVTLCLDHDIIDGGPAARFARDFRRLVENPTHL